MSDQMSGLRAKADAQRKLWDSRKGVMEHRYYDLGWNLSQIGRPYNVLACVVSRQMDRMGFFKLTRQQSALIRSRRAASMSKLRKRRIPWKIPTWYDEVEANRVEVLVL